MEDDFDRRPRESPDKVWSPNGNRLFLGLDPGVTGAVALVSADGCLVLVEDLPTTARGSGRVKRECNAAGLAQLLRPYGGDVAHGVVELVAAMPRQGVASMFSIGHSAGTATAVLACLGIGFELLPPAKWKRLAELPADKALVLTAARRLWPDAPLRHAKDHGRAEALCMARLAIQRHGRS